MKFKKYILLTILLTQYLFVFSQWRITTLNPQDGTFINNDSISGVYWVTVNPHYTTFDETTQQTCRKFISPPAFALMGN